MGKPRDVADTRYLQLRGRTWYVRVAVPPSLVKAFNKRSVLRSLQTRDLREAQVRRHAAVAMIMEQFAEAEGATKWDPIKLGLEYRERYSAASIEPQDDDERYRLQRGGEGFLLDDLP